MVNYKLHNQVCAMSDTSHQIYKNISKNLLTNSPLPINQLRKIIHYRDREVAVP